MPDEDQEEAMQALLGAVDEVPDRPEDGKAVLEARRAMRLAAQLARAERERTRS